VTKRTSGKFERKPRDLYPTPYKAVQPLLPHLEPGTRFFEPCAGDGRLIGYLQEHGHVCFGAWDIEPLDPCIKQADALNLISSHGYDERFYITNSPWERELLHRLIVHLSGQHPTWLLFDADWMHTKQAIPYLPFCHRIVSVGRVRWLEGTDEDQGSDGMDNAAWYFFTRAKGPGPLLYGRVA
jgi:hypothetical protein